MSVAMMTLPKGSGVRRSRVRNRRFLRVCKRNLFITGLVFEHGPEELVIQVMSRLIRLQLTDEAVAQEVSIADGIQDLVNHKLVGVAQSIFIENTLVVE